MKRTICIICVLLASLCILTSCQKSAGSLYVSETRKGSPRPAQMTELATVKGICADRNDEFALFIEQPVNTDPKYIIRVFGFDAGKVIYEAPAAAANADAKLLGYGLFAVKTPAADAKSVDKWTVYDAKGKAVREFNDQFVFSDELLFADHAVFEMKNGTLKQTDIVWNEGGSLKGTRQSEKYRFATASGGCFVYDLGGNPLSAFTFPSYAANTSAQMLSNGNVLIQYSEKIGKKGDDGIKARDYDFIDDSDNLCKLHTYIIDPKTGHLRSLNVKGFILVKITRYRNPEMLAKTVDNLVTVRMIADNKRLDNAPLNCRYAVMSNTGSLSDVKKMNPSQASFPAPVSSKWWLVACADGSNVLYDKSGRLIATLTASDDCGMNYIVRSGMILDEKGNMAVDLNARKLTLAAAKDNYALLSDAAGNTYLYCDGKVIDFLINSKETVTATEASLILTETTVGADKTVSVYNQTGEKLGSVTNKLVNVYGSYLMAGDLTKQETVVYSLK